MSRAELRAQLAQLEARRSALESHRLGLLEQRCSGYPEPDAAQRQLLRLEQLLDLRQALVLELALLSPAPEEQEPPKVFRDQTPEQAVSGAKLEYGIWLEDSKKRPFPWYWLLLILAGAAALVVPHWIGKVFGVLAVLAGTVLFSSAQGHRKRTAATVRALEDRYAPLPPERWIPAAEEYARHVTARQEEEQATLPERQALSGRIAGLDRELTAITRDKTPEQCLSRLRAILSDHTDLSQARRECRNAPAGAPDPALNGLSLEETVRQLADCAAKQRELRQALNSTE